MADVLLLVLGGAGAHAQVLVLGHRIQVRLNGGLQVACQQRKLTWWGSWKRVPLTWCQLQGLEETALTVQHGAEGVENLLHAAACR